MKTIDSNEHLLIVYIRHKYTAKATTLHTRTVTISTLAWTPVGAFILDIALENPLDGMNSWSWYSLIAWFCITPSYMRALQFCTVYISAVTCTKFVKSEPRLPIQVFSFAVHDHHKLPCFRRNGKDVQVPLELSLNFGVSDYSPDLQIIRID